MTVMDQVNKIVDKQLQQIDQMEDLSQIDCVTALSSGFLSGMALAGTITFQERKRLDKKIIDYANNAKREKESVEHG